MSDEIVDIIDRPDKISYRNDPKADVGAYDIKFLRITAFGLERSSCAEQISVYSCYI